MSGGLTNDQASAAHVHVRVPAKVNLFLGVEGRRADGYHELVTVLQTVSLYDEIVAELASTATAAHPAARRFMELVFALEGEHASVPANEGNLAVQAARLLMEHVGVGTTRTVRELKMPVTHLSLTKRIPVAAGMAGGSADAAATLVALNQLWYADLPVEQLQELAATLGADVPFCVSGGTALATGTGTQTVEVLSRGNYHWVVGINNEPLATPEVYRAFDEVGQISDIGPDAVLQALRTADPGELGAALHNDLEVAAIHLRPELAPAKEAMLAAGACGAIVSGSGPTVVALATSGEQANDIAAQVADRFDRVEVAESPAGGPELTEQRHQAN